MSEPSRSDKKSAFIYLLNAMEGAAQSENPFERGYGEKRQAVLDYVAKLEAGTPSAGERIYTKEDAERLCEIAVAAARKTASDGCPCTVEGIEPCSYACSCARPMMSGGCQRCARYGSLEQRQGHARYIAEALSIAQSARTSIPQLGIKDPRPCVHAIGATTCGYPQEHRIHEGSIEPAPPAGRHVYTPPGDVIDVADRCVQPK